MTRLAGPDAALREGDQRRVATWMMAALAATITDTPGGTAIEAESTDDG